MSVSVIDLTKLDSAGLALVLRDSPVSEWNRLVREARSVSGAWGADLRRANLWRADLRGADLWGADLRGAHLGGANLWGAELRRAELRRADLWGADLRGADLRGADLWGAYLGGAHLWGADLRGADLGDHKLTGRAAWIGEAAGYPVLLLATETGHVLRAGCWTGQLHEAVRRATDEDDSELVRLEAEAVVAHGFALLDAWAKETKR